MTKKGVLKTAMAGKPPVSRVQLKVCVALESGERANGLAPESLDFSLVITLEIHACLNMPLIPGALKQHCFQQTKFHSNGGPKAPNS